MKNFIMIGDGRIAQYHRKAIEHVGGKLAAVCDPAKYPGGMVLNDGTPTAILTELPERANWIWRNGRGNPIYVVICSPSNFHREQLKFILNNLPSNTQIICEKPAFLPWEPPIDSERLNICLQLRYLPNLPEKADKIYVRFVRDELYFKSWKGDPKNTGGLFYSLFIHYIDLAQRLGADFEGAVKPEGTQERYIGLKWSWPEDVWGEYDRFVAEEDKIDILNIDMQTLYNRMYEDILNGGGIKPRDLFYLDWILKRNSELFGYGKNGLNRTIKIGHELL